MARRSPLSGGERYGTLTVLGRDAAGTSKHPRYAVRCDCGNEFVAGGGGLRADGRACWKCREWRKPKYGPDLLTQNEPLHHSWVQMRKRCRSNGGERTRAWWGNGIKVCQEWEEDYMAFREWSVAHGYAPGLSLDRVDGDKNYEPGNCEWVTRSVNSKRARARYVLVRRDREPLPLAVYLPIEALFGAA